MSKIVSLTQAVQKSIELRSQHKRIVMAGGCFDILHLGHIKFLQQAKKQGDILLVLLESDEHIKQLKGPNRPVNTQVDRAAVLAALQVVDYVITLPVTSTNQDYEKVILPLKPAIIATTKGDPGKHHKDRIAKLCGAIVVEVISYIVGKSTTAHLENRNK